MADTPLSPRRLAYLSGVLPDDAPDVRRHRKAGLVIQCGERLIQQQDLRIGGQRADQGAALAHAAGELVRVLVHPALRLGDAHHPQQLHGAGTKRRSLLFAGCS
mgnify:CR=1 FL=1